MKILTLLLLLLTSCGIAPQPAPDTLRVILSAEPDTLNPLTSSDAYASRILDYVNDSLIERNRDTLEYEPKMAASWEIAPDKLQYIFHLKPNVRWQDGRPFTADDVVYSFERIMDEKVEAPFLRVYYADIKKVEKIDDLTVRFLYTRPYYLGLSVCGTIPLVPKHLFDDGQDFNNHPLNRTPVGLGPYRFVSWETNKKIILERNEDYWGTKPDIKRIEFRILSDDTIAFQLLKKGEIDSGGLRPIQWVRQTGGKKFEEDFHRLKYLLPGFSYIGWNQKSPYFSDKRVRQAMTMMIDREKILEKINFGLGRVVEGPFFVEGAQYNPNMKKWPHDPSLSKALLKEAGWEDTDGDGLLDRDGKPFKFLFLYPSGSKFSERVAPIMKEDLAKIGVQMDIERMEWAAYLERIAKKEFDATAMGWSTGYDDDPYQIWHSSQAKEAKGSNFISFENKEVDRLIEEARMEFDEEKRNKLYWKFQDILNDEQPYTFLFASYSLVAVSKRFDNVVVHKAGLNALEWKPSIK